MFFPVSARDKADITCGALEREASLPVVTARAVYDFARRGGIAARAIYGQIARRADLCKHDAMRGRPCDILKLSENSFLVSDDSANVIYYVRAK
jgi:hypothetical protein